MQPLVAQDPGQTALLVARVAALGIAAARVRPEGRVRIAALAGVAAAFVASLVARDAWWVAAGSALIVAETLASAPWPRAARIAGPAAIAALALASVLAGSPAPPATGPRQPRAAVAYWRDRGNLLRARAAALGWANAESPPGEGYLALAEVDWALGDATRARKVLQKVAERGATDAVRARAAEMERAWGAGPAAP